MFQGALGLHLKRSRDMARKVAVEVLYEAKERADLASALKAQKDGASPTPATCPLLSRWVATAAQWPTAEFSRASPHPLNTARLPLDSSRNPGFNR
jgi:hypothetical protein